MSRKTFKHKPIFISATTVMLLAANLSFANMCNDGIVFYANGNFEKAMQVFKDGAKAGDVCAKFQVGMMYFYGHGVEKNNTKAREWINKAAQDGFEKAKMQLSMMKTDNLKTSSK